MKSIILFVIIGIFAYAGGLLLFTGISAKTVNSGETIHYEDLTTTNCRSGIHVDGEIHTLLGEFAQETTVPEFFGFKIDETQTMHYYILQLGYEDDIDDQRYIALALTNNEDIEAANAILDNRPRPLGGSGASLKINGVMRELDEEMHTPLRNEISLRPGLYKGIAGTEFGSVLVSKYEKHIHPYVIYVTYGEDDSDLTILIGSAVLAVCVAATIIIIVKKYREKSGY